ncbi:MAG TPA: lmo0937 family membrane protein [Chitinophagaceae bacterium]|nr:lmo0937 family membrane protein [Chitinophagaceae bacterium]HQX71349.1 lmo0937 family membrane protein [Chitinophagaceae bacterium]HQZ75293.1 lmo0937 family membrane protein [Chitinophagaceae bacterium]
MSNLLYLVAVILIIGWVVGYFGFNLGGIVHLLLVIALVMIVARLIQGKRAV